MTMTARDNQGSCVCEYKDDGIFSRLESEKFTLKSIAYEPRSEAGYIKRAALADTGGGRGISHIYLNIEDED